MLVRANIKGGVLMQEFTFSAEEGEEPRRTDSKPKPTKIFPTDRIAFSRQLDLLRAYAAASAYGAAVVNNNQVADLVKLTGSTVSLANPFFADARFLQRADGGYTPSAEVVSFARAYEWNPDAASHKLAPVVRDSWFAKALLPRLGFSDMDEAEAIAALAEAASAGLGYKNQLRVLLDYLESAGLIRRDGGRVHLIREGAVATEAPKESPAVAIEPQPTKSPAVTTAFAQPMEGTVQFHVSVRVDIAEFAGWQADRIAAFFNGIAQVLAAKGAIERGASQE
jgi:hypothetical protein